MSNILSKLFCYDEYKPQTTPITEEYIENILQKTHHWKWIPPYSSGLSRMISRSIDAKRNNPSG